MKNKIEELKKRGYQLKTVNSRYAECNCGSRKRLVSDSHKVCMKCGIESKMYKNFVQNERKMYKNALRSK